MTVKNRMRAWVIGTVFLGLAVAGAAGRALGQEPGDGLPDGRTPVSKIMSRYRLGVYGVDTDRGFRVRSVIVGSRASRLYQGRTRISLETGDYITEVNGDPITRDHTLYEALAESEGVVDLRVWDGRYLRYRTFEGVRLDVVRR